MEQEMFTFFPKGIRTLLVDDDPKFSRSTSMMLSLLHFTVVMCSTPSAVMKLLIDNKIEGFHVVLCDAHKVAKCGFDLRAIVESEMQIPVIYYMSKEGMVPSVANEEGELFNIIQSSTYIINKPLDPKELSGLWRVVAYRKYFLASCSVTGNEVGRPLSLLGSTDDANKEDRVHYKAVREYRSNKHGDKSVHVAGGDPREISNHVNMNDSGRLHLASHLQPPPKRHRDELQNDGGCNIQHWSSVRPHDRPPQKSSQFVQAVLPAITIPVFNPLIGKDGAGPTNIHTTHSARSNASNTVTDSIAPTFSAEEPRRSGTGLINFTDVSFAGNASRAPPPWPAVLQEHANKSIPIFPQLSLGPFAYQGQSPPSGLRKILTLQNEMEPPVEQTSQNAVEPPVEQRAGDLVVAETSEVALGTAHVEAMANSAPYLLASLNVGAAPSEAILEALLKMNEPAAAAPEDVPAASHEAKVILDEGFDSNPCTDPLVASQSLDGVPAQEADTNATVVTSINVDDYPLEDLMELDVPMDLGGDGVTDDARVFPSDGEGYMGNWNQGENYYFTMEELLWDAGANLFMQPRDDE